ncbi:MAG: hypothetical protein KIT86_07065 [Hydrogenophaga sp.]|uniref:hypothetical protein n=1 Tax=Hydrogenophaga sp. TaxID=1904254 RepID=UPI00261FDE9F|nr:hypothetical protein [Hydrogenophaga sp.]MCW5669405.1 hypothetical protein [Hydrogenophaga sp.]
MIVVHIQPLPAWARGTIYRPGPRPIFQGGEPTREDVQLALALFDALDAESQEWYGGQAFVTSMQERLAW